MSKDVQIGIITSSPSSRNETTVLQRCKECRKPILSKRGNVVSQVGYIGMIGKEGALILLGKCPSCHQKYSLHDPHKLVMEGT